MFLSHRLKLQRSWALRFLLMLVLLAGQCIGAQAQLQRMAIPKGAFSFGPDGGSLPAFCLDYTRHNPTKGKAYNYLLTPTQALVRIGNSAPVPLTTAVRKGQISIRGDGSYSSLEVQNNSGKPVTLEFRRNAVVGSEREIAPNVDGFNLNTDNLHDRLELAQKIWIETDKPRQKRLQQIGYYKGAINGLTDEQSAEGIATRNSIKRFQRNHGLKANGIFDRETEAKMSKVLASRRTLQEVNRKNKKTLMLLDGEFPAKAESDGLTLLFSGQGDPAFEGQGHDRMAQKLAEQLGKSGALTAYIRFDSHNLGRMEALEKSLNLHLAQHLPEARVFVMPRHELSVLLDSDTYVSPGGISKITQAQQGTYKGYYAFECKLSHPTRPSNVRYSKLYNYSRSLEKLKLYRERLKTTIKAAKYKIAAVRLTNRIHADLRKTHSDYSRSSILSFLKTQFGRRCFADRRLQENGGFYGTPESVTGLPSSQPVAFQANPHSAVTKLLLRTQGVKAPLVRVHAVRVNAQPYRRAWTQKTLARMTPA